MTLSWSLSFDSAASKRLEVCFCLATSQGMSDLYPNDAPEHRTRSQFGEVHLQAPTANWFIMLLVFVLCLKITAALLLLKVETTDGPVVLIDWFLSMRG